ncbi:TPA: hypothetical protein N0F65_010217 [Lagenidium giganteum]|uniref:Uncharacterized protein n=1 Tax=Lagenidium giganteum TaxID=4803 RepID=A0AAV2Z0K3_9STRA|nr:TPA: hypothetical protein N0F65_010217 [Lagenidium giganteum]
MKWHYGRILIQDHDVKLIKVSTAESPVDMLTKAMSKEELYKSATMIGMHQE